MKKILATLLLSSLFPALAHAQPGVIRIPDKPITTTANPNITKTADFDLMLTRMERMEREMKSLTTQNAGLQKRIQELEAQQKEDNAGKLPLKLVVTGIDQTVGKLVTRVSTLETKQDQDDKNTTSVKLLLGGLDKSVTSLKGLFDTHVHKTTYSYETLDFLLNTPNNNKGNFYIPYVWLGGKGPNRPKYDKIKDVQPFMGKTGTPLPQTQ